MTMTNPADIDSAARTLYNFFGVCSRCHYEYSLADALLLRCPFCEAMILPGPDIDRERGREMLSTLRARREELRAAGLLNV